MAEEPKIVLFVIREIASIWRGGVPADDSYAQAAREVEGRVLEEKGMLTSYISLNAKSVDLLRFQITGLSQRVAHALCHELCSMRGVAGCRVE
jgi:hypothetical protein